MVVSACCLYVKGFRRRVGLGFDMSFLSICQYTCVWTVDEVLSALRSQEKLKKQYETHVRKLTYLKEEMASRTTQLKNHTYFKSRQHGIVKVCNDLLINLYFL